tara:strand:+ start:384 stop:770 length:387 start_codon:yes stop_codon:yes gene_type:complete
MNQTHEFGKWAFLFGVLISLFSAVLTGFLSATTIISILFVLGLAVGLLNVSRENSVTFLLGVVVLLILGVGGVSTLSQVVLIGFAYDYVTTALGSFIAFVGAAGLVVAIRAILDTNQGLGILKLRGRK